MRGGVILITFIAFIIICHENIFLLQQELSCGGNSAYVHHQLSIVGLFFHHPRESQCSYRNDWSPLRFSIYKNSRYLLNCEFYILYFQSHSSYYVRYNHMYTFCCANKDQKQTGSSLMNTSPHIPNSQSYRNCTNDIRSLSTLSRGFPRLHHIFFAMSIHCFYVLLPSSFVSLSYRDLCFVHYIVHNNFFTVCTNSCCTEL